MNREKIDQFTKMALNFLLVLGVAYASLQIIFYKENPEVVLRYVVSLMYLYTLPGYFLINSLIKEMDFGEKVVIGTGIGFCITSILAYYLGLLHLGFITQVILLPLLIIILGVVILVYRL